MDPTNHQMGHHASHEMGHKHMNHADMMSQHQAGNDMNLGLNTSSMSEYAVRSQDHDHMLHGSHGSGTHSSHSMGSMTFHGGYHETVLFSWWTITSAGEFIGSFIAIFLMALLYEGLKYYRKHLLWKTYTGLQYCAVNSPDKSGVTNACAPDEPRVIQPVPHALERNVPRMISIAHGWQTVLHGIQVLVSYMLMLVFMTYNTWLCLSVVLGSATGYFLFGWRESVVVDFTEHCH